MTRLRLFLGGALILWLALLAVIVKTSIDGLPAPSWGNPIGTRLSAEVTGDSLVGQQFTAPFPGLYRIDIDLVKATASQAHQIIFHLRASAEATEDLRTASLSSDDLRQGKAFSIEFPVIRDSERQTFYFYLESPDSMAGNAIAARYDPNTVVEGASAYLNHQPVAGNLEFHTYYSMRTREKVDLLLSRMAEGRPYLLGTKGFYIGVAFVYALVLAVFLMQIALAIFKEVREGS